MVYNNLVKIGWTSLWVRPWVNTSQTFSQVFLSMTPMALVLRSQHCRWLSHHRNCQWSSRCHQLPGTVIITLDIYYQLLAVQNTRSLKSIWTKSLREGLQGGWKNVWDWGDEGKYLDVLMCGPLSKSKSGPKIPIKMAGKLENRASSESRDKSSACTKSYCVRRENLM